MLTAEQQHAQRNRGTIFVDEAEIVSREKFAGDQYIVRLRAPKCAAAAEPGSFAHITCDPHLPMRRPLSIMRVVDDCIDVLYKIVGDGLQRFSEQPVGTSVSVMGPIGKPFQPDPERPNTLLIGGGVGIPPMVFLADHLRHTNGWKPLAILGSELPFPFKEQRSSLETPWVDANINATMPLLEDWGLPCRLATLAGFDGCFDGYVTDLADRWLRTLSDEELAATGVFSCGPTPMLQAVAALAAKYNLPCQVSLEEFMACAVGGCAGCAVRIHTPEGEAMQRVCVDGPVFEAATVAW